MLILKAVSKSTDSGCRVELTLNGPSLPPQLQAEQIFFELEGSDATDLSILDGLVGTVIHFAMETRQPLHVEGRLTRKCLRHLSEYQRFWSLVQPNRCSVVNVTAEEIVPDRGDTRDLPAVAAYSGGVDSAFTLIRHCKRLVGIDTHPVEAVMILHGFDVDLADTTGFALLLERLQPVIEEFGLRRYVVHTNIKRLAIQDWTDSYAAQLVGCMHLVSHRHSKALVASDGVAQSPIFPWGGNPISVPLLTTGRLKVYYEGADYGRTEKVALIAKYPTVSRALKFCWQGPEGFRNCGKCMKCFMTYMNFRAVGVEKPECFHTDIDEKMVGNYEIYHETQVTVRYELLEQLWRNPDLEELTARFSAPIFRFEEEAKLRAAASADSPIIPAAGHVEAAHGQSTKRTWGKFFRLKS